MKWSGILTQISKPIFYFFRQLDFFHSVFFISNVQSIKKEVSNKYTVIKLRLSVYCGITRLALQSWEWCFIMFKTEPYRNYTPKNLQSHFWSNLKQRSDYNQRVCVCVCLCVWEGCCVCVCLRACFYYVTTRYVLTFILQLSLIHIWRCRRYAVCRSRWSPYH